MSLGVEHRRLIAMRITCPCRKSVVLPSLLAISLSLTGVQATGWENTDVGTNGAGIYRTWTPSRAGVPPFGAEFCQVVDGCVTLFVPIHVSFRGTHTLLSGTVKKKACYPLSCFSASDRRWIEDKNPTETCLISPRSGKANPKNPLVGTLTPKSGSFRVTQILDRDTALIDYLPGSQPNRGIQRKAGATSLRLRSKIVRSLKDGEEYDSISCNLDPKYRGLTQQEKETYGVDFKVTGRVKKNKEVVFLVEDNR